MALVNLVMPKLGEGIMEATVLKWTKQVGDLVKQDETLLEIATDKVDSEVPSTVDGVLKEVLFNENDVVPVGAVIAVIENEASAQSSAQPSLNIEIIAEDNDPIEPFVHEEQEDAQQLPYVPKPTIAPTSAENNVNRFYSPLVISIANSEGITMSELEKIEGTGSDNRVTKKDILDYVENRKTAKSSPPQQKAGPASVPTAAFEQPAYTYQTGNTEVIEMDRMRKMIAKHMVSSKQISPHVTSFSEADVTNMVAWREKMKNKFAKTEGIKITYTPMFIACVTRVIKRYPFINCSIEGDNIILKKDINIGMATALPSGSLIVPVIKNADHLNLVGLAKTVNGLAENARNNRLKPDDTAGGTFTITNVGTFGSLTGTPIINQPQVAILAVGAIKKRPVVIETPQGDTIGIRQMMYLSLSYDHRVVDGSIGASFLTDVAKEFENWDVNSEW